MIEQLILDGFKSFRHTSISIEPLNILSGLNSSGKSSVIQSIRILDMVARKRENVLPEELGDERSVRNKQEAYMNIEASYGANGEKTISYLNRDADNKDFPKVIYVSADRIGPQHIYMDLSSHDLGAKGENVLKCIEHYSLSGDTLPEILQPEECDGDGFRFVVQAWLKKVSPGVRFSVEKIEGMNAHKATYNSFSPYNVGFGLSYSLSIIVALLMGVVEKNSIVLLENPEAHIHAKGQTAFADLICRAVEAGAQVIVETHSDHIFDGVRIYAKEHPGFAAKTNMLWFKLEEDKESLEHMLHTTVERPILNDNGQLSYWPEDMYLQFMNNAEKLF